MITVIIALLSGLFIGRLVGAKVLKVNDVAFMFLSTIFIFIMGISLGLSRSTFAGVGNILTNSLFLAIFASLGSIIFSSFFSKLLSK